jgi:putative phage-type endonuclease
VTREETSVQRYLRETGGRRGCPHPAHRMATVYNSPAELIVPECAGHDVWLEARRKGIGGSEVGALIGVSEYETPMSVWQTKIDGGKDLSDVPAVEWGHRLEEVVAQKTAEQIGMVHRFAGGLWADKQRPHLRVTPDRFACKPRQWDAEAVIECKTAGTDEHWRSGVIVPGGPSDGDAPLGYQAQVQWQLGIIGLPVGYLGCLVMGRERQFFVVEIHFNKPWFEEMVEEADRFWRENVVRREIPMHDLTHPRTESMLKKAHPAVVRPSVDLPDDAAEWLAAYQEAKQRAEEADRELREITNYFRMMTGDAGAGYLNGRKVISYPEVRSSRVDVAKLKKNYPDIAAAVTVETSHRRLTIRVPRDLG